MGVRPCERARPSQKRHNTAGWLDAASTKADAPLKQASLCRKNPLASGYRRNSCTCYLPNYDSKVKHKKQGEVPKAPYYETYTDFGRTAAKKRLKMCVHNKSKTAYIGTHFLLYKYLRAFHAYFLRRVLYEKAPFRYGNVHTPGRHCDFGKFQTVSGVYGRIRKEGSMIFGSRYFMWQFS